MGAKLQQVYDLVTQKAGLKGRMRLAVRTGVSKIKAATMEDTDKVLKKFKAEATEIIGQDVEELL
jgi:phosphoribosyl-ATP pyrophosphohydrolase